MTRPSNGGAARGPRGRKSALCVYVADSPEAVREHALVGGFPCTNIREIGSVIDPTTDD